ncbi:MAG: SMC-Scp complex subunit ScpB [Candidatus Aenigmarchaeota archaeon]|nr:SMC-Scp complex subunit ScpB [Candidatus Aenigmarchaeota archaeon]
MKVETKISKLKPLIEAALFMSSDALSLEKMRKIFHKDVDLIKLTIDQLKKEYNNNIEKGMYILETAEGYQLKVKPEYLKYVATLTPHKDLSRGLLKVLALVAYKQPITQSQIVKVIGNRTYDYVKKLERKGLIRTVKSGRTKALIATKEFANYFGLQSTEDFKRFFEETMKNEKKD